MSDLIHGNFLVYQSEDGSTRVDVRLDNENIWLNQKQLAELFGKAKGTISEHIRHIFEDGELDPLATVRLFRTVQPEGRRAVERDVEHYNLVEQYLIFAEGQCERRIAMTMQDWIKKLEGFLLLNDRDILQGVGKVSARIVRTHAETQFEQFHVLQDARYESDFDRAVKRLTQKKEGEA